MERINCYLASGWFNPQQKTAMDKVRSIILSYPEFDLFAPFYDGIVLDKSNDSPEMRRKVFDLDVGSIVLDRGSFCRRKLTVAIIDDFEPGTIMEMGASAILGWLGDRGYWITEKSDYLGSSFLTLPKVIAYSDVSGRGLNVMLQMAVWGFANGEQQLREQLERFIIRRGAANFLEFARGDFV